MMILSIWLEMILWTMPGTPLRIKENTSRDPSSTLLRNDLAELKSNLQQDDILQCGELFMQANFHLLTDQVLHSILFVSQNSAVSSVVDTADLLSHVPTNASNTVLPFLNGLVGKNPVLTEAAYVVSGSDSPKPLMQGRADTVLIVYMVTRTRTNVDSRTLTLDSENGEYRRLKAIADMIRATTIARMGSKRKETTGEKNDGSNAMVVLEKQCSTNISGQKSDETREWRIMLGFVTHPITKDHSASPVFFVTLPLRHVDLNQCDDSQQMGIGRTHGCMNYSTCTFLPGGGFDTGHYKCCCQSSSNFTSTSSISTLSLIHQQNPFDDQCFDGKLVEEERSLGRPFPGQCLAYFEADYTLRMVLLAVNVICVLGTFALIFVVMTRRKIQDWGSRGWALMELFLLGAILLYSIVILEYLQPKALVCCLIMWCRELGFALFYGAVLLKIYRNLFEHRVRKAHHVYIKEKDLLKYLLCIVAFTVVGLVAWTVTAVQDYHGHLAASIALLSSGRTKSGSPYVVCTFFHWNIVWHFIELAFLAYGAYLSYKGRNTTWNERRQFSGALLVEMSVSLVSILVKNSIWLESSPDTLILLSFIQVHLTVTVVLALIMATKLYYANLDPFTRAHSVMSSGPNKPHPSLAKLRDNLVNGTVDFAEVPIAEMNPDDIRTELKRVYTQLRMYKLSNLYMENPHTSKRKGGKTKSNKPTLRRFSIPTVGGSKSQQKDLKRLEMDERSSLARTVDEDNATVVELADLTIESSPHNIYLSRTTLAAAKRLQLESDLSVRI